jgi:hypothetical protein
MGSIQKVECDASSWVRCQGTLIEFVTFRLLWAFVKLRKAALLPLSCSSVCLSARMDNLGCHWTGCYEFWYANGFFLIFSEKIGDSLKCEEKTGISVWKLIYIYHDISLNSSQNDKCVIQNLWRIWKNILHSIFFFRKSCHLWDNVEKYGTAREATGDKMAHCTFRTLILLFPRQQV